MPVVNFPYEDTFDAIKEISIKYPYASNLLCAVILERCLKRFAFEKGFVKNKKTKLGKIIRILKTSLPKSRASNLNKIKKLRDDYIHSNESTESCNLNYEIRVNQYNKDNKEFQIMLDWVKKEQYF